MKGLQLGIVKENYNDTYAGMVKVMLLACDPSCAETFWARVASPYAGNGYGMYLLPEVGDSVLVGFIGDDMGEPVILGGFWGATNAIPTGNAERENKYKTILTQGGNSISFTDGDDGSLQMKTANGHNIIISDKADSIKFKTKDEKNYLEINERNGEIIACADKKVSIKAGKIAVEGEIVLSGAKISAKSDGELALEGKSLQMKGNTTKLSAQMMEMSASASAKLECSAVLTLKGSMVKIN